MVTAAAPLSKAKSSDKKRKDPDNESDHDPNDGAFSDDEKTAPLQKKTSATKKVQKSTLSKLDGLRQGWTEGTQGASQTPPVWRR